MKSKMVVWAQRQQLITGIRLTLRSRLKAEYLSLWRIQIYRARCFLALMLWSNLNLKLCMINREINFIITLMERIIQSKFLNVTHQHWKIITNKINWTLKCKNMWNNMWNFGSSFWIKPIHISYISVLTFLNANILFLHWVKEGTNNHGVITVI